MAESTTPGPLGSAKAPTPAAPKPTGPQTGLLGDGAKPGPIGSVPPVALPQVAAQTQELNLVGDFPKPTSWTPQKELQLIGAKTWFPSTDDFLAVAGRGSVAITNTWDFLLKIVKAPKQISRLNFFSHGIFGQICLQGVILPDGSNVIVSTQPDTAWTQVFASKAIMDPFAKTWGSQGENSGSVTMTVNNTTFSLDTVRKKFTADATIWLYLCHSSGDPRLFQEVANTFQVTAKGFKGEIVYCAQPGFPTNRKHKIAVTPTDACTGGDTDFKKLDKDPTLQTATPQKP
jgi:hypothetical protein